MISGYLFRIGMVVLTSSAFAMAAQTIPPTAAPQTAPTTEAPQTQPVASASSDPDGWRVYRESCRQILNGDFRAGHTTLQQVVATESDLPNVSRLKGWMAEYRDLSDLRDDLHGKEYQSYVTKAQEHAAKAEWSKAMDRMASAFWTASSEEKFRQEAWLKDFSAKAFTYAEDLRKRGEWTDATRIYAELALVFPDDKTYKELRTRCQAHAQLEATYNDPDWKDRLGGITPEMTRDAFGRIDKYYYNTPDLKKMGVDSIERLMVLAETTALFKVFNGLNNPEKRQQFIAKLRRQADQLDKAETVGVSQLHSTLEEVLAANRATVGLPDEVVISEYVNGGFEALDRYSSMIWPAEQAEFRKHTTGEFSGVGIQISMENEKIKVFSPLEDTPAYKAGVEPGDTILAIEGKPVKGITLEQAVRRITGEAGTSVTLTMERPGLASPFDVKMKRQKIVVPTVKGWDRSGPEWNYFIDKDLKIAYLRVVSFTETTTDAFRSALEQLHKQGMKGVIVDLRVNPGGLLKTAVEMCEMFLPRGKDIVSTKGRASEPWQITSRASGEFAGLPLIILINDYSASASEIMAGALHAQGAALLVGERSWGKGSVQNPWPLGSSDAMLKLTTALYYLPFMERSIHRDDDSKEWGVAPDVQVKLTPKEARRVLELRRNSDVLPGKSGAVPATATAPATQPGDDEPDEGDSLAQNLKVDPQVETALLLMRVRLLSKEPWSIRMASASAAPAEKLEPAGSAKVR
jgi:carboxyl-terminal processing protease